MSLVDQAATELGPVGIGVEGGQIPIEVGHFLSGFQRRLGLCVSPMDLSELGEQGGQCGPVLAEVVLGQGTIVFERRLGLCMCGKGA